MLRTTIARLVRVPTAASTVRPLTLRLYATNSERKFTRTHEWILVENGVATVGVTDFAQDALGQIIFAELPEKGQKLEKSEVFGAIESVKASSDVYAPVDGEVVSTNDALSKTPHLINESPFDKGWLIKLKIDDDKQLSHLLDEAEYKKHAEGSAH